MSAVPYIKFFPSDWLSEESLRLVSFAARGLWIDMLCLMAKNERRGYLEVNGGVNPTLPQLAKLVGSTEAEIAPLLAELKAAKTCSIDANGVLFSRRLVRDTESYSQAVSYGKKGGNPRLTGGVKTPVKPTRQPSLGSGFWPLASGNGSKSDGTPTSSEIYQAYPRKKKPKEAQKAIERAISSPTYPSDADGTWKGFKSFPEYLLDRTKMFALATSQWPTEDHQFVPYPASWFNAGCYDEDPKEWSRRSYNSGVNGKVSSFA